MGDISRKILRLELLHIWQHWLQAVAPSSLAVGYHGVPKTCGAAGTEVTFYALTFSYNNFANSLSCASIAISRSRSTSSWKISSSCFCNILASSCNQKRNILDESPRTFPRVGNTRYLFLLKSNTIDVTSTFSDDFVIALDECYSSHAQKMNRALKYHSSNTDSHARYAERFPDGDAAARVRPFSTTSGRRITSPFSQRVERITRPLRSALN